MASTTHHFCLLILIFISVSGQIQAGGHNTFRPTSLFVFGDSYADTGNTRKGESNAWKPPYGTTFPGKPTGRFSDGGVLTDYFASYFGLKSPVPYSMRKVVTPEKLKRGMNFAYGGAGVFDTDVGVPNVTTQIDRLEELIKRKVYGGADLTNAVALITVAGNDYTHYVATNGSFPALPSFIASLVNQTSLDLMRLHGLGLKRIVVNALQPLGCLPLITDLFGLNQCLDIFNNYAVLHNRLLNHHILHLNRVTHKHNTFFVLDLYTSFNSVLTHRTTYNIRQIFKSCCTGENASYSCASVDENGVKRYKVCDSPKSAFFWDMVHPTSGGWHSVYTKLRTMSSFQLLRAD